MSVRGHRAVEHTADEILEAWGPSRAACLEEAVVGLVALFAVVAGTSGGRRHTLTLDGRDDRGLLLDLLGEVLFLADAEAAVPAGVHVEDRGDTLRVHLDLADLGVLEAAGPAPKGVSRSGLHLRPGEGRWTARAIIDI